MEFEKIRQPYGLPESEPGAAKAAPGSVSISRASCCRLDCSSDFRACCPNGRRGSGGAGRVDMAGSPRGGGFAVPAWDCFEKDYYNYLAWDNSI